MTDVTFEVAVILLLLMGNGYLALSEIAIVSARRSRLVQRAERGDLAARAAADLSQSPTKFLSTVQVGITLIGILSGAYGGATIAGELALGLERFPGIAPYAEGAAVGLVVVVIAYVSVVIGELVPKRIALSDPERFASAVARPMVRLSRIAAPAVAALDCTSNAIIRLFRLPQGGEAAVTEADVAAMLAAGTAAGVFEPTERRMVERVFRLDEPVAAMMTPRREIVWLDVNDSPEAHADAIRRHPYSRFPVCDGSLERVVGTVNARDIWIAQREASSTVPVDLRSVLREPLFVPDGSPALDLLGRFQTAGAHMALVIDEHGSVEGLLTLNNILLFLVAPPAGAPTRREGAAIVRRGPDSWLVDGALAVADFYTGIGMADPDEHRTRGYHTVAGLALERLGRVPAAGDQVEAGPLVLEIVDMDGPRVDKILVTRRSLP